MSRGYEQIYRDFDGIDGFCSHDVAAAVLLTDPQLFETEEQALRVDTSAGLEGHARILDQSERALGRRRRQRIGVRVDGRAVVETWFNVIGADHAVQAANAGSRHGTPKERR